MAVKIFIDNQFVRIRSATPSVIRKLEKVTSYYVQGYFFSPAFRSKRWDGKEHLLKYSKTKGYRAPVGLLVDILKELKRIEIGYKLVDQRRKPNKFFKFGWNEDFVLRDYQNDCVEVISGKPLPGRGIVQTPIRSGKTLIAAAIIKKLGVSTLFVVPSRMLLYQTKEVFENVLCENVGIIGDGHWNVKPITVATAQSLHRAHGGWRKGKDKKRFKLPTEPRFKALAKEIDLAFFDEAHHLTADGWHEVMQSFNSFYKLGLSATVFLEHEKQCEKGVIWLKACCGEVQFSVTPTELIEKGFMMRPKIQIYKVLEPSHVFERRWSVDLKHLCINCNPVRNALLCELVEKHVGNKKKVLVISNRLNQIEILDELFHDAGLMYAVIVGKTSTEKRKEILSDYKEGIYDVLLGTVFGEGVDLPSVECVINAEGGKDVKATIQRMRNLTPSEGKKEAIYIDFADLMNPYFSGHSLERLKVYRAEEGFGVKLLN